MECYLNAAHNVCLMKDIFAKICVGKLHFGPLSPNKQCVEIKDGLQLSGENLVELLSTMLIILDDFVRGIQVDGKIVKLPCTEPPLIIKHLSDSVTFGALVNWNGPDKSEAK